MSERILDAASLEETRQIGQQLGAALRVGDVVALIGPLGSGKTTLVKAVAVGAGVADPRQVNSPTFVIVNEYKTSLSAAPLLYHVDAYRLRGGHDLEGLGFEEMVGQGAVVIEWADRVADILPVDRLTITIEPVSEDDRRFHCWASGTGGDLLERIARFDALSEPP